MSIELIVDGIIDLIKKNLIAKTDLLLDASAGDTIINVKNAYRFHKDEEIVLIDWGYNNEDHQHYQIFEYAEIKRIIDTKHIELKSSLLDKFKVIGVFWSPPIILIKSGFFSSAFSTIDTDKP